MKKRDVPGREITRLRFALPVFFTLFLPITGAAVFSVNNHISINTGDYANRITYYRINPTPAEWDGLSIFKNKQIGDLLS